MRNRINQWLHLWILGILSAGILLAAVIMQPISQPAEYHQFVDQRIYFGIPNFFDVTSNLFLLLVGLAGLVFLMRPQELLVHRAFIEPSERWPYFIIFLCAIIACFSSIYYHLEPDNTRLAWDRLPIAIGITTLLAIMLIERIDKNIGFRLLPFLIVIGVGSVIYWYWTEQKGVGNLNFYIVVQFYSPLAIILIGSFSSSRYTRSSDIYRTIVIYVIAKIAELLDREIYSLGQIISGHTLKHLFAGLAVYWIFRMLQKRRPLSIVV